jgi:hypothetical protein
MKNFLLIFVATLALVGSGLLVASSANAQGRYLHPLSQSQFDQYCLAEGHGKGVTAIGSDAESLRCVDDDGSQVDVEVDKVCASAYPEMNNPTSRLRTMGATYSAWQCMDAIRYVGPPDLESFCESKGAKLVFVGHPSGYDAYGWRCSPPVKFTVTTVCKVQYGHDVMDRVEDVRSDQVDTAWGCYVIRKSSSPGCPRNPTMATIPDSGVVGSKFVQKGNNWLPGGTVHLTLPSGSKARFLTQSATPRVGLSGGWQTVATVSEETPPGTYTYTATEQAPQCPSGNITKNGSFTVR